MVNAFLHRYKMITSAKTYIAAYEIKLVYVRYCTILHKLEFNFFCVSLVLKKGMEHKQTVTYSMGRRRGGPNTATVWSKLYFVLSRYTLKKLQGKMNWTELEYDHSIINMKSTRNCIVIRLQSVNFTLMTQLSLSGWHHHNSIRRCTSKILLLTFPILALLLRFRNQFIEEK